MKARAAAFVVLFASFGVLAAACGGSDSGGDATAAAATTSTPKRVCPPPSVEGALSASDVGLEVTGGRPDADVILFNDWAATPNVVRAMHPDGSEVTEVLRANRVWSLGATLAGDRLALSVADPMQEAHFGITIGDAVQQTWLVDFECGSVTPVSTGNLNDECHAFSPDGTRLFLCRRQDFSKNVMDPPPGYDVGFVELSTLAYTRLVAAGAMEMALHPAPLAGGSELLFTRVGLPKGERSIFRAPTTGPGAQEIRKTASAPVVSPDGKTYAYADTALKSLFVVDVEGLSQPTLVVEGAVTGARFSPDGKRLVYLRDDTKANCSHVEVALVDGSTPKGQRIRDCAAAKDYVTEVAWIAARGP